MAEVVSKSNVFSSISHHNQHRKSQVIPVRNGGRLVFSSNLGSNFVGLRINVGQNGGFWSPKKRNFHLIHAKVSAFLCVQVWLFGSDHWMRLGLSIGKAPKWWEKGLQLNMKEITSAQDLVDSLQNAGDKLVVIDFFSPGCGGCKALHPKICQLAEMNPDVQFLQVNYEEHKSMCYSLNVHVLPFFRFYRGAEGRVCSFSCTNATIRKFKDALARYSPDRCSLGPAKGLEEKELLALAANKDLSFTYTPKPAVEEPKPLPVHQEVLPGAGEIAYSPSTRRSSQDIEEKTLVTAGS